MTDPLSDQQAVASREASRQLRAFHDGEEVAVRTYTAEVTSDEAEALARGEVPPGVQAQLDRQAAEDEAVVAIEDGLL